MKALRFVVASIFVAGAAHGDVPPPSADSVLAHVLESDPFGFSGATVAAHVTLTDRTGSKSNLAFTSRSKRLGPALAEGIVRFSAPPELAGAGFLQIQKKDGDDDRFLFLPELKRSRRISGGLRSNAFMGTDLSFADLDRRDLRDATATLVGSDKIERWDCYLLDVVPRRPDSQYSHAELWARKEDYVPLRMKFYDHSRALLKTLDAIEVRRVSGQWFVSRLRVVNVQQNHTTEMVMDQISTEGQFGDDEFTVRTLEKSQ
jgi:hypothetical protein